MHPHRPNARLFVLLTILSAACTSGARRGGEVDKILLITIDSARADRLGAYGYPQAQTPTLDALAEAGTTWRRAYTTSPWTVPALATLHTGRTPPAHGLRLAHDQVLSASEETLAELLRDAGWGTYAFVSGLTTHRRWGLHQGFDVYYDAVRERPGTLPWRVQTRADRVVDDALATLASLPSDEPAFVWVHLYDTHWPHSAPRPFSDRIADPYDAEMSFADSQIGRLVGWWDDHVGAHRSWVAVTSPHGDGLGEGGEEGYGYLLNDDTLHVPMIVRGPGLRADREVEDVVSLIDWLPTALKVAKVEPRDRVQGRDLTDGGSEWAYHETQAGRTRLGLHSLVAVTDDAGRVTQGTFSSFSPALGLWVTDKAERLSPDDPLVAAFDSRVATLGSFDAPAVTMDPQFLRLLSALGEPASGDPTAAEGATDPREAPDALGLTRQIEEQMGTGLQRQAVRLLAELRQRLPTSYGAELLEARIAHRQGRVEDALRTYKRLFHRHPTPTVAVQLAGLCDATGNPWAAITWYDAALRLDPESPEALAGRIRSSWAAGFDDEAEDLVSRMTGLHQGHPELTIIEAEAWLRSGRPIEAQRLAHEGIEALPWSPWARATLGAAAWELGKPHEAIDLLQGAVALDPYPAALRLRLADFLLEVQRHPEALRAIGPLARVAPEHEGIQGVFQAARLSLTLDDWHTLRRRRALGPTGRGY